MADVKKIGGQKFGRLTALRISKQPNKHGKYLWSCICDCGAHLEVLGTDLRSGNTTSCGCYQKERSSEWNRKHGSQRNKTRYGNRSDVEATSRAVLASVKFSAKRREIAYSLADETALGLISKPCNYCGEFDMRKSPSRPTSAPVVGIDRIDSDKGYTDGNCVSACEICNKQKLTLTLEGWKRKHLLQLAHFAETDIRYREAAYEILRGLLSPQHLSLVRQDK